MTVAPASIQSPHEHHPYRWAVVVILALAAIAVAVGLLFRFDVFGGSPSSTVVGSGVPVTQTREVAPFISVELAGSNNVVISAGEKQSVVVRADDNLVDSVTTEVQKGKLVIGNTESSFTTKTPMHVFVNVPSLDALALSGSGNVVARGIDAEDLAVLLSGSGTLTGSGSATTLDVTLVGSGSALFGKLVAKDVQALVAGSGNIVVTATTSLDAAVPGSGSIFYLGNPPRVTKSITGIGSITAKP
jgi:putative autotransporter adhesin-like protein